MLRTGLITLACIAFGAQSEAQYSVLPAQVGECAETRITQVTEDVQGAPGGGTFVRYENGGNQISYEKLPGLLSSEIGDPVRLCLASVAEGCPPGDERGRFYEGTNLRTGESWEAPSSLVLDCGGA
jgi:hypothetical protein